MSYFHTYDSHLLNALSKLRNYIDSLFTWLKMYHMKTNGGKSHFLVATEKSVGINIDGSNARNKKEQKLLGIKFDSKFDSSLSFKGYI